MAAISFDKLDLETGIGGGPTEMTRLCTVGILGGNWPERKDWVLRGKVWWSVILRRQNVMADLLAVPNLKAWDPVLLDEVLMWRRRVAQDKAGLSSCRRFPGADSSGGEGDRCAIVASLLASELNRWTP